MRQVLQIDPSSVDNCFLFDYMEKMRKKIDGLIMLKKIANALNSNVKRIISQVFLRRAAKSWSIVLAAWL